MFIELWLGAGTQQRSDSQGSCPTGAAHHQARQTDATTNATELQIWCKFGGEAEGAVAEECDLRGQVSPP